MKTPLVLLLPCTLGLAFVACTSQRLNEDHCANNDGDAYCAELFPDRPLCNSGEPTEACSLEHLGDDIRRYGCVDQAELRCPLPCGNRPTCDLPQPTDSTSTTETSAETRSTTDTTDDGSTTELGSTTDEPECRTDDDCPDPDASLCIASACASCSASIAPDPDAACALLDPATPLCRDDRCVQCTPEEPEACPSSAPLCDPATNTCIPCSFHEQCQDLGLPACNIALGSCFPADAVTNVDASIDGTLQPVISALPARALHTIVLTSGGGDHGLVIDQGKTIAFVSDATTTRALDGDEGSPSLTITGRDTTVFLHRIEFSQNGNDVGIAVEAGSTLYADSTRIVQNSAGGLRIASDASAYLRNCMIGRNGDQFAPSAGIDTSGRLEMSYSSIVANDGNGADSLRCSGRSVLVRNSIVLGSDPNSSACPSLDATHSVFDQRMAGEGNDDVGALLPEWFQDLAAADFGLTSAGSTQFMDIATWQLGDPPFDFDGDLRPSRDGAPDYPGADVP